MMRKGNPQKPDLSQMTGEEIWEYYNHHAPRDNYQSVVMLLRFVIADSKPDKFEILEQCVRENKKLMAVYPSMGERSPKNGKIITDIPDGTLYIVPCKRKK